MSQLLQNSESCAICPLKYCRSAEDLLIYNAMKMSDGVLLTHNIVYNMFIDEGIKNRSFAVEWMNRVRMIILLCYFSFTYEFNFVGYDSRK